MRTTVKTMVKKVTAAVLAAVAVMTMATVATPATVRADDFKVFNFEELPDHPTSGMDVGVIKSSYTVGGKLGKNTPSGTVVYIQSSPLSYADIDTPRGSDIVVICGIYHKEGIFGCGSDMVCCKSLTNGNKFEIPLGMSAQIYELNKAAGINSGSVSVSSGGLETTWTSIIKPAMKILDYIKLLK